MGLQRRGFLTSMLTLGAAPAIVKADSLMKLWVPPKRQLLYAGTLTEVRVTKTARYGHHSLSWDYYGTNDIGKPSFVAPGDSDWVQVLHAHQNEVIKALSIDKYLLTEIPPGIGKSRVFRCNPALRRIR